MLCHTQIAERDKKVDERVANLLAAIENLLAVARRDEDRHDKLDGGEKQ